MKLLLLWVLFQTTLLLSHHVKADVEEDLLRDINSYRATLKLTTLRENDNAECFADELADQFKNQPCTNTSGANTVPGTENQFNNYPDLLKKCHLNVTVSQDGVIMPACVPNLDRDLVRSNYTESQYSRSLNDTKYTGAGIGSEGNWVVVVLTTDTSRGNFAPADNSDNNGAVPKFSFTYILLSVLLGFILVCLN